ncbi:MAG TPA: 2-phosphosulfolactate phosphatase [Ktedonobacteraceae bacterium]|nr:2-phosphosulfolactate phosphatase [Ktedonobacteraceae bacterium]
MLHTPVFQRVSRDQAGQAEGIVIVIDVIRAFTVAAHAFAGGAKDLWLVRTVEDALALRELAPDALLAGEIGGRLIPGFDLNNSPYMMARANVRGRRIIQRTGAGTQGAVGARHASHLLVTSLATARATARYVARLSASTGLPITFVPTESSANGVLRNEDRYCADYIEALIVQPASAGQVLSNRLARLEAEGRFHHWGAEHDKDFPPGDLDLVMGADRCDFIMRGTAAQVNGVSYVEVQAVHPDTLQPFQAEFR